MSMPDDLFTTQITVVVTAIVVFRVYVPHPKNKETYFGYWKDDGFVKRKNKERVDAYDKWEDFKIRWLDSYVNRKSISGLSVTRKITATDEWCAEAYMETDYSTIDKEDFLLSLKKFVLFKQA